jgi:DNA-binding LacI/PurR family transcriptional regulator
VTEVARRLGYVANPGARNLRRGRTGTVGLYFPQRSIALHYYMDLAIAAAEEALEHDLALTLIPATGGRFGVSALHVDGVVVSDPALGDPMIDQLAELGVPAVTIERDLTGREYAGRIEADHVGAIRGLLTHLTERGAQTIGLICSSDRTAWGHDIRAGYLGWCKELRKKPIIEDAPFVSQAEDIATAARRLLTLPVVPDAIVSAPDGGATALLQVAPQLGLDVPQDLMIAVCSDPPPMRTASVPITAIDITPQPTGRQAIRLLAELISGRAEPGTVRQLPTELRVRASTSPQARPDQRPRHQRAQP